jgi:hypothetical protein
MLVVLSFPIDELVNCQCVRAASGWPSEPGMGTAFVHAAGLPSLGFVAWNQSSFSALLTAPSDRVQAKGIEFREQVLGVVLLADRFLDPEQ